MHPLYRLYNPIRIIANQKRIIWASANRSGHKTNSTNCNGERSARKDVSDAKVLIPALVIEFFIGTKRVGNLKSGQALLINPPSSWQSKAAPGSIEWSRLVVVVQRLPEIDEEIGNRIADFAPTVGGFIGELRPGESSHWNADFVLRARPENMAGAVLTFWARGENEPFGDFTHTRTELLSEAEDAASLKAQGPQSAREMQPRVQLRGDAR
jgi:hypothetical protein